MGALFSSCFGSADKIYFPSGRQVVVVKDLGEGGFSYVYLVKDSSSGDLHALKKMRLQLPEQEKAFKNEVNAHQKFNGSSFVVQLIDSCIASTGGSSKEGLLLLEYFKEGTMQEYVERQGPLPQRDALRYFGQLCEAAQEFHSRTPPLAHRDIKPANLLRSAQGRIVLMDLGSVAEADAQIKDRKQALALQEHCAEHCTAPYRAPELFEVASDAHITSATDMWSMGCTLFFMVTGRQAFDGTAMAAMSGRVNYPQDMEGQISDTVKQLISACLHSDPSQRPTAQALLETLRSSHDYT